MTHPLTPPPELVQQWFAEIWHEGTPVRVSLSDEHIATRAAQWGADQELEACCEWLDEAGLHLDGRYLRAARRPKPPSLKEQAVEALHGIIDDPNTFSRHIETIRRALEALPE